MSASDDPCPHGDKTWRCPTCCLLQLRQDRVRLRQAVTTRETGGQGGPRPAFGSREPINTAALALEQDIQKAGGLNHVEQHLNTLPEGRDLNELRRNLRQWRSRCSLILRDALAPYVLTWDTPDTDKNGQPTVVTRPVQCPVVNEYGDCAAPLYVHRDDDPTSPHYGKAAVIRCKQQDDHQWTLAFGGWLQLGVLLGGTMGDAA